MNRGFRAPDSKMPGPLHHRPGMKLGSILKEKEEELSLFLELRKREKERTNMLLRNADEFPSLASKSGGSPIFKVATATASRKVGSDDFLNSDSEKNDYDWLLTPPGTPLFPSLEKESHACSVGQIGTPKARPTVLKSRLSVPQSETAPRGNPLSRQPISTSALNTSSTSLRRPISTAIASLTTSRPSVTTSSAVSRPSGTTNSTASRPSTPTGRSTLPAASKPSRASTPTSRATLPSTKPVAASGRPATPSARSSTPTARPTLSASKSSSRPSTPTRRPSTPSAVCSNPGPPSRSTSGAKSSTASRNAASSRGTSPTVRSRPWQPSEMPGFSLDAPPNLRTSMPERPVSASRGRPVAPNALKSGSSEGGSNGKPRRQSCSPTGLRGRVPSTGNQSNGSLTTSSRLRSDNGDNVSPVVIGSKMVERVINLRRLAPPRQDNLRSSPNNPLGKSASPDSTGFGRTLSKKSLDMALRHMDIRRSIPGSLRPLMTNVPASSMYSVRSGPARSRPISISDSPLATSSNASSEQSVSNSNLCLDVSEVEDDDLSSEKGFRSSPAGLSGRSGNGSTNWLVCSENHV
ncbi:endochitinase A1-like [Nymphaea colorata]|nr:endochitinase A1-like [Nymphaea colorata]